MFFFIMIEAVPGRRVFTVILYVLFIKCEPFLPKNDIIKADDPTG